jgi:hypothetical protein
MARPEITRALDAGAEVGEGARVGVQGVPEVRFRG